MKGEGEVTGEDTCAQDSEEVRERGLVTRAWDSSHWGKQEAGKLRVSLGD